MLNEKKKKNLIASDNRSIREVISEERTLFSIANEIGCKFHVEVGCLCVCVLVFGLSINGKFGIEFQVSCR